VNRTLSISQSRSRARTGEQIGNMDAVQRDAEHAQSMAMARLNRWFQTVFVAISIARSRRVRRFRWRVRVKNKHRQKRQAQITAVGVTDPAYPCPLEARRPNKKGSVFLRCHVPSPSLWFSPREKGASEARVRPIPSLLLWAIYCLSLEAAGRPSAHVRACILLHALPVSYISLCRHDRL